MLYNVSAVYIIFYLSNINSTKKVKQDIMVRTCFELGGQERPCWKDLSGTQKYSTGNSTLMCCGNLNQKEAQKERDICILPLIHFSVQQKLT